MSLDLAILGDITSPQPALKIENAAAVGVYKLLQKVIIILFKDIGDSLNLGKGTQIPQDTLSANSSKTYIENLFTLALDKVRDDLNQELPADAPPDEILSSFIIEVLNDAQNGTLSVNITISSEAGASATAQVPITKIT